MWGPCACPGRTARPVGSVQSPPGDGDPDEDKHKVHSLPRIHYSHPTTQYDLYLLAKPVRILLHGFFTTWLSCRLFLLALYLCRIVKKI